MLKQFNYYNFSVKNFQSLPSVIFPYLVIECDDELPSEDKRPFLVACLIIAVLTLEEELFPFGIDFIEEHQLRAAIWRDLKKPHSLETFMYIHKLLPSAQYVSSYPTQILVECYELPDNEFGKLIESAPSHFGELFVGYMNGELIKECHGRAKTPNPRLLEGEHDDTNYLRSENGVVLSPGVLLECYATARELGFRKKGRWSAE